MPPQQNQSLASMFMGQLAMSPLASMAQKDLGLKNPADIYVGVLGSRSIQDELIKSFDLARVYHTSRASKLRKKLASRTRIQLTKEGLLTISVEDGDPQRAAALANGYAEQLRSTTNRLAMTEAAQRRQMFEQQAEQTKEDLNQAETVFRSVQQKTGILEVDAQGKALIESSARLRSQIAAGEVELRSLRAFGTAQNPDVRQQEAQLNGWRAELARLESAHAGDPVFSKGKAPEQAQEYFRALRDVKYREAMLEMLLKQLDAAKLDEAKEGAIIQIVDVAVPPDVRSSPKRTAIVFFTMLIVICLTTAGAHYGNQVLTKCKAGWSAIRAEW
jgi:uncharacterized protein involved in exopolysaccharide biosynthesis